MNSGHRAFHVLLVTADRPLGESRGHVLRLAGCSVVVATYDQARHFVCIDPFHVAVICQSIPTRKASALARELRRWLPATRILRLTLSSDTIEPGFDRVLAAPIHPLLLQNIVLSAG